MGNIWGADTDSPTNSPTTAPEYVMIAREKHTCKIYDFHPDCVIQTGVFLMATVFVIIGVLFAIYKCCRRRVRTEGGTVRTDIESREPSAPCQDLEPNIRQSPISLPSYEDVCSAIQEAN